jgi:rod shape-determining protein MreC
VVNDQIINPVGVAFSSFGRGINENFGIITRATGLAKENKTQANEILALKNQLSTLKEVANENDELRAQLNFNERLKLDLTAARVVSSEGTSLRKFITIDRGRNSGLKEGMAVVSSGVLIGTIDRVEDFSSTVFLSTDPDFRIRALGQDGRAQGIVRGQLGQGYLFDKITQAESIKKGELVITAGSGLVPRGILIGEVESASKSDNAVFQSAQLRPLVNISSLEIVFIVTGLKQ